MPNKGFLGPSSQPARLTRILRHRRFSIALFKVFSGRVIKSIKRLLLFFFYSIVFGLTYLMIIGSIIFSAAVFLIYSVIKKVYAMFQD